MALSDKQAREIIVNKLTKISLSSLVQEAVRPRF